MPTKHEPAPRPPAKGLAAVSACALALTAFAGCASQHLAAGSLPSEYRARPGAGMQRVRLGGLATAAAPTNAIGPEDLVEITIATGLAGEEPIVQRGLVARDGTLEAPLVGRVRVAGAEPGQAAELVAQASVARGVFLRPQVSVEIIEQATNRVTVLGSVGEPGVKELPRASSDLLSALAAAGGLDEEAGVVVEVLRSESPTLADSTPNQGAAGVQQASFAAPPSGRPKAELIDLSDPDSTAGGGLRLGDRDVVVVRPKEQRVVHVMGLVEKPAQFELMQEHDLRLLDAIAMAGGTTTSIADKVLVVRQSTATNEPVVIEASISRAKTDRAENLILQSGDLVTVESTPATVALQTFQNLFRITMGVGGNLTLF